MNGLRIRLDEHSLAPVLVPLEAAGELKNIMLDVELWSNMPDAVSNVLAVLAALYTRSWPTVVAAGVIGYVVGGAVRVLIYSELLRVLLPMLFGGWIISSVSVVAAAFYLVPRGGTAAAVAAGIWVLVNTSGLTEVLEFLVLPINMLVNRMRKSPHTWVERLFLYLCAKRAQRIGIDTAGVFGPTTGHNPS
jgi:hypothetical protein